MSGSNTSDMTRRAFLRELAALREAYPMCYVEAWTPDDYGDGMKWNDPAARGVAECLYAGFDANVGTNWDRVDRGVRLD
jgi:hypothetical protein